MDYTPQAEEKIIDAKILVDKILYGDDYHGTLKQLGIARDDVKHIYTLLDDLIYTCGMDYSMQSETPSYHNTENPSGAREALNAVRLLIDEIDDPWLWTEWEYQTGEIISTLDRVLETARQ